MDRTILESLQLDRIFELIEPISEAGRHFKHHLRSLKPGQENLLRKEYQRLERLQQELAASKQFTARLSSYLAEIPWLPQTMKALQERTLYLHEFFEVKKLVYYAQLISQSTGNHNLNRQYPFPRLDILYAMLDPDQANSPAFFLSPAFDTRLAGYVNQMQELQLNKTKEENQLLKAAQKALKLNKPIPEIVISRLQAKEVKKLEQCPHYQLVDENFANLTFRLKDTPRLSSLKKQIAVLAVKLTKAEEEVLGKLSKKLLKFYTTLAETIDLLQQLDWDYAKAVFAIKYTCCLPSLGSAVKIEVKQAVNLPLKLKLTEQKRRYQPLDLKFEKPLNVITGPNMGGKTNALHTIGQLCILAQYGIPVPAAEARLCLFDHIWYNKETEQTENLSSFGKEIVALAGVLRKKGRTLYLVDEFAKGTNPLEGEAILSAVLDYLSVQQGLTLAATHFERPAHLKQAVQYAIKGIDTDSLTRLRFEDKTNLERQLDILNQLMDYSPVRLAAKTRPPANAILIADALGLPAEIVAEAMKQINI